MLAAVIVASAIGACFFLPKKGPAVKKSAPQAGQGQVQETPKRDEAAAAALLADIHKKEQKTNLRVMLIGWDSADWQMTDPLLKAGRLPNLQRVVENGASAYLRSYEPMFSPLLWNSIATGKLPSEHGVVDFVVLDAATKKLAPINATFRKSMALWNMLSAAEKENAFVAWWATWPAEPVRGFLVSDRVSYSLFSNMTQDMPERNLTYPEDYYRKIKPKLISEKEITDEELSTFIHLSPTEIKAERAREYPKGKTNPVAYLAQVIASARNYQQIALDLLARDHYELFSVYFEALDQVNHLFAHCTPPKMDMITDEEFRRYKDVVPRFYEFMDQLTGPILEFASKDSVVMLLSDHGFKNGGGRPTDFAPFISERPGFWHREYGIFLVSGGPVRKKISIDTVRIFDAAPTILYLLGLPVGQDLHGRVLTTALDPEFVQRFPLQSIPSWEPLRLPIPQVAQGASPAMDAEALENLAALGYIGNSNPNSPAPAGSETASYHRNLVAIYLHDGNLEKAEEELQKSMSLGANVETYALMFELRQRQKKFPEAIDAMSKGVHDFPSVPGEMFIKLIQLCVEKNRIAQARELISKHGHKLPSPRYILFCNGRIQEAEGNLSEAEKNYYAALKTDPTFAFPIDRLYRIYNARGELEKLGPLAVAALRVNDQLAIGHNILGVIFKKHGKYPEAISEYQKAIDIDPDNSTFLANLAAVFLSMKKPEVALAILMRAKEKNEKDVEVWTNLGAVYGTLGRDEEGLTAFRKVRDLGADSPNVELGIAAIYAQKGDVPLAMDTLQKAMTKYPNNPDLKELMAVLKEQ